MFFFSVRTTKGVGSVTPPPLSKKTTFISINGENSAGKLHNENIILAFLAQNWVRIFCQNPFQAIIRLKKKVAWTTKPLA